MLEYRGWKGEDRKLAEQMATSNLREAACTQVLAYSNLKPEDVRGCLKGLHRSHEAQDGSICIYTHDGRPNFIVNAQSAQFIRERLGEPVEQGALDDATVGRILDRGYKAIRGWGIVHSHAGVVFGVHRSDQSPLPSPRPVSLQTFSSHSLISRENFGKKMKADAQKKAAAVARAEASKPERHPPVAEELTLMTRMRKADGGSCLRMARWTSATNRAAPFRSPSRSYCWSARR
jgi:hypothetical protein